MAEPVPGGTPGQVLTKRGYNDYEIGWDDPTGGGGGTGTPANSVTTETAPGQPSSPGTSLTYARGDHTHGTPAHPLPTGGAANQVLAKVDAANYNVQWATVSGGGTPATSVVAETTFGAAAAVGTATNYARQDHTHGTPPAPAPPAAGTVPFTPAGSIAATNVQAALAELDTEKVAVAGATMTGELVAPDLSVSGLTGATSGARFVGATASGYPAAGTFTVGDWVIDRTGQMWICTVAGSPGSWQAPGAGRELGYAEIVAVQSGITGNGFANRVDVTGLQVTVTVAARPILVVAQIGSVNNNTAGMGMGIALMDNDVPATAMAQSNALAGAASGAMTLHAERRAAYAPGAKTFKVMAWAVLGGSVTISGGAGNPAFIHVREL